MLRIMESVQNDNERRRVINHQFKIESHGAFLVAFRVPNFLKLKVKQS